MEALGTDTHMNIYLCNYSLCTKSIKNITMDWIFDHSLKKQIHIKGVQNIFVKRKKMED